MAQTTQLNTSLVLPLSGETIFNAGGSTITYTTSGHGIVYLTGIFTTPSTQSVLITLNTRQITFAGSLYVPTITTVNNPNGFGSPTDYQYLYPTTGSFVTNLLDTTTRIAPSVTVMGDGVSMSTANNAIEHIGAPGSPADRNRGPYLPVKRGDVFIFGGTASSIGSFLYF